MKRWRRLKTSALMPPSEASVRGTRITAHRLATAAQLLTFVAAFLGLFARVWYLTAVAGGLALTLYIGSLIADRRERRNMQSQVDRIVGAVDLDHVLRETAHSLGLGGPGRGWRLSLYRLDFEADEPERGQWQLEARAANQRAYELARDLVQMSLRQGVLRTAVASADQPLGGIDEMPPLPDPEANPDEWRTLMSAWGLSGQDLCGGMRSRVYCGRVFRVGLNRGKGQDMTLGLVAESEDPIGVRRQAMEDVLTRPVFELLYELIRLKEDMRASLSRLSETPG